MLEIPSSTDVFVVGGGPAGLAAAIALRARGFDVTLADHSYPPIDKPCGEGLMPDALAALRCLGIHLDDEDSFQFRGIRFLDHNVSVDASFPNGFGIGVRRPQLHQVLVDRAAETGVHMLWGTSVRGVSQAGVILNDRTVRSRWIVGADGGNSRVRRWAGLDSKLCESVRFGFRRHYRVAPWTDCMEIYWGSGYQIYVTPIAPREVCVAAISRNSHLRLDLVLPAFPSLNMRLKGAGVILGERGAVSPTRTLEHVYRGNVILIGDASGSVDAITGEGLRLSFEQSMALAEALVSGDLKAYQSAHRRLARRPRFMGSLMLLLDRSAWLRRRALRALSENPQIFEKQLAMHVGDLSTMDFIRSGIIPLGREILHA